VSGSHWSSRATSSFDGVDAESTVMVPGTWLALLVTGSPLGRGDCEDLVGGVAAHEGHEGDAEPLRSGVLASEPHRDARLRDTTLGRDLGQARARLGAGAPFASLGTRCPRRYALAFGISEAIVMP
jgi:hypothetical protein